MTLTLALAQAVRRERRAPPPIPAASLSAAATAPLAFVEMVHVRTFHFDPCSCDDVDAFQLATTLDGPCIGIVADGTVTLLESNGEAVLQMLKAAGIDFSYESSWVPSTEEWIEEFRNPPRRDQDDWH